MAVSCAFVCGAYSHVREGIRDPGLAEFKDTDKIEGCCKPEKKLLLLNCETMHEVGTAIQW